MTLQQELRLSVKQINQSGCVTPMRQNGVMIHSFFFAVLFSFPL